MQWFLVIGEGLFSNKKLEKYYKMADEVEPVVPEDIRLFIEGMATISSTFLGLAGSFTGMNEKGVSYGNYFYASGMFEDHVNERRFANLMTLSKKYHGKFNLEHLREAMHAARQFNENHIRHKSISSLLI